MIKSGIYAFHFSGFTMKGGNTYYLVGAGTMEIAGNTVAGEQSSSITRINTQDETIVNRKFTLAGDITPPAGGKRLYHAVITFVQEPSAAGDPGEELKGDFDIVDAGDRLWMISTKVHNNTTGKDADEVMSGEAVLVS